jgi:5-methylcytosine-specific restriction endonuclease McrA
MAGILQIHDTGHPCRSCEFYGRETTMTAFEVSRDDTSRHWRLPENRKPLSRKEYAEIFLRQDGRCPNCGQRLNIKGADEVEVWDEHVRPLWAGGSNNLSNRELWCKPCTKPKTAAEAADRAKSNAVRDKHIGAPVKRKSRPIPGSRASAWKRKFDGTIERR